MKKYIAYSLSSSVALFLLIGFIQPANAFSLKIPTFFTVVLERLQINPKSGIAQVIGGDQNNFQSPMPESPTSFIPPTGENQSSTPESQLPPQFNQQSQTQQDFQNQDVRKNSALQISQMRRGAVGMEKGITQFETQIKRLQKQGVVVPQKTLDALTKAKTIIKTVRESKDAEEIEGAMQDLQEVQETLNEERQNLEMLSRWPQTLKQLDRELRRISTELKKNKTLVNQLIKKGFTDITDVYNQIEAEVNTLKATRDAAVEKAKSGEVQEAFELLEGDFFDKMPEIWERFRVIQTISNLGRFASEFKKGVAQGKREIANLKRQKKDITDLQALFDQIQTKGNEITSLLKASVGSLDEDTIMDSIQELEAMKQQFDSLRNDLSGGELRPWESGGQKFNELGIPAGAEQQ